MDSLKAIRVKDGWYVILTESYRVKNEKDVSKLIAHHGLKICKPEQKDMIFAQRKY